MSASDLETTQATVDDRLQRAGEVDRLRTLVEASGELLGSLGVEDVLPRLLDLAQRTLAADAYSLWRYEATAQTWSVAASRGLSDAYVATATEAIRTNTTSVTLEQPVVAEDIEQADWLVGEHRRAHLEEGTRALLAVGLRQGTEILGTLAFYYRRPHRFTRTELDAAATLANLASAAVSTAELLEQRRRTAEERALIAEVSDVLNSSLDYASTLANVARLVVPRFADWCSVDIVSDENLIERLAVAHVDPDKARWADELAKRYPPDPDAPYGVPNVIRTKQPEVFTEIPDELLVEATRDAPELLGILRELGLKSTMCIPLVARDRVLGAITFVSAESGRLYDASDLIVAQDLARRAAIAVDNARLLRHSQSALQDAESAHERLAVLAEISQELASTLDYQETLSNLATLLVPRYADWYAVDVDDGHGGFRRLTVFHRDPAMTAWAEKSRTLYPPVAGEAEGTSRVVRTGEPVLYAEVSDELLRSSTLSDDHYETLKTLGMASAMVVPLTAGGQTFGALMLVSADSGRRYDQSDLDFAQHLGRRVAVAVDNARLYRATSERAHAAIVVEHVADGVMLVDREDVVSLWNPAAERITGLPADQVVGRATTETFPAWRSIATVAATGDTRAQTHPVEIGGRELWLSVSGVAFDEGTVYAFRDLTEEQAVERLKSDFVATVSHELRTPLAAIYGAALTLRRDDIQLGELQRDGLLEVVANESDRLARIVNDILWASRLESGTLETTIERCDAVELARGVIEAASHYAPPNIELSFDAPDEAPQAACDRDKVRQVLTNLVDNAVKYSPDGGTVAMRIDVVDDRLRFSVSDEGLGVPEAEQERIFQKFYRLDPNLTRGVGGTGLGLYISRELVERMAGRIWVESRGGAGSTFFTELPLA
jgi:PAS domain S-box-containing protein